MQRDTIAAMRLQLERLRRMQFGRSSEKVAVEIAQLTLALEDLETGAARNSEPADTDPAAAAGEPRRATDRHVGLCRCICHARR